jgi:hypothetical protein
MSSAPPWLRLAIGYGCLAVTSTIWALSLSPDAAPNPLVAAGMWILLMGGLGLCAVVLFQLFAREYARPQIALVSWIGAATGLMVGIVVGRNVAQNAIALAALYGLGSFWIGYTSLKRRSSCLPPPPGATPAGKHGDWASSSLRPPSH